MEVGEVWQLLEQGGGVRRGHWAAEGGHSPVQLGRYNGLLDPAGAERLGELLAGQLEGRGVTQIAVWEQVEDVVLGFVVARHLGAAVLRTFDADGLVGHVGSLSAEARAVLVIDAVREPRVPRAVQALLDRSGGSLLGVAALIDLDAPDTPLLARLVSARDALVPPATCPACRSGAPLQGDGANEVLR
jgi:hypothetical protein